eukprot:1151612-Rhodomonas_salina.1
MHTGRAWREGSYVSTGHRLAPAMPAPDILEPMCGRQRPYAMRVPDIIKRKRHTLCEYRTCTRAWLGTAAYAMQVPDMA